MSVMGFARLWVLVADTCRHGERVGFCFGGGVRRLHIIFWSNSEIPFDGLIRKNYVSAGDKVKSDMLSLQLFRESFNLFPQSSLFKCCFTQLPTLTRDTDVGWKVRGAGYVRLDHAVGSIDVRWRIENRWAWRAGKPNRNYYWKKNSVKGRGVSNVLEFVSYGDVCTVIFGCQLACRVNRLQTNPRPLFNLHNTSLARINGVLKQADAYQRTSYKKFDNRSDIGSKFSAAVLGGRLCGIACLLVWSGYGQRRLWLLYIFIALGATLAGAAPIVGILVVYRISHVYWGMLLSEIVSAASAAPIIDASTPCYGASEKVRVFPIVVPKSKLCNVERHVFGIDLVDSDNSALGRTWPARWSNASRNMTARSLRVRGNSSRAMSTRMNLRVPKAASRKRPDWSRPLPAPLVIPKLMTLKTLGDVLELLGHLPKEHRAKHTWQYVAKTLDEAARGGDPLDVSVALRMVLMLEGIWCRAL